MNEHKSESDSEGVLGFDYKPIEYEELTSAQQENYNYQKVCAVLADYGFSTIRLTDDWEGADFIAQHAGSDTFLKVQLKGRLSFAKNIREKTSISPSRREEIGTWFPTIKCWRN